MCPRSSQASAHTGNLGSDLCVTHVTRREGVGGAWVSGFLNGHQFEALVFPDHADCADWELGDSRISKLWVRRLADKHTVFTWDRGRDVPAQNETVQAIVNLLSTRLADHVYAE